MLCSHCINFVSFHSQQQHVWHQTRQSSHAVNPVNGFSVVTHSGHPDTVNWLCSSFSVPTINVHKLLISSSFTPSLIVTLYGTHFWTNLSSHNVKCHIIVILLFHAHWHKLLFFFMTSQTHAFQLDLCVCAYSGFFLFSYWNIDVMNALFHADWH